MSTQGPTFQAQHAYPPMSSNYPHCMQPQYEGWGQLQQGWSQGNGSQPQALQPGIQLTPYYYQRTHLRYFASFTAATFQPSTMNNELPWGISNQDHYGNAPKRKRQDDSEIFRSDRASALPSRLARCNRLSHLLNPQLANRLSRRRKTIGKCYPDEDSSIPTTAMLLGRS